jgi:DNA-binding GntR family transcriptional regulator
MNDPRPYARFLKPESKPAKPGYHAMIPTTVRNTDAILKALHSRDAQRVAQARAHLIATLDRQIEDYRAMLAPRDDPPY